MQKDYFILLIIILGFTLTNYSMINKKNKKTTLSKSEGKSKKNSKSGYSIQDFHLCIAAAKAVNKLIIVKGSKL